MRHFIVEVVLNAILLAVHRPVPRDHLRRTALPLRPDLGPDPHASWRGRHRLPVVGRRARPGQPIRPTGARRVHRPPVVLDDGFLRRDHQRRSPSTSRLVHRPDQDRRRRPTGVAVGDRRGGPVHGAVTVMDAVLGLNRPDLGADRTKGVWGFLESCPPRVGTPSSRTCASSRSTARSTRRASISPSRGTPVGQIRRWFARVVLGDKSDLVDATGPERIGPCSSSSDRPT